MKKKYQGWAWYPFKRLEEGKGIVGKVMKKIDNWEPLERVGNPEKRRFKPLVRIKEGLEEIRIKKGIEEVKQKGGDKE